MIYKKNNTNFGGALARNEGIKCATGDYVTFLDDDDIYLPDKILAQLEYMVVISTYHSPMFVYMT